MRAAITMPNRCCGRSTTPSRSQDAGISRDDEPRPPVDGRRAVCARVQLAAPDAPGLVSSWRGRAWSAASAGDAALDARDRTHLRTRRDQYQWTLPQPVAGSATHLVTEATEASVIS